MGRPVRRAHSILGPPGGYFALAFGRPASYIPVVADSPDPDPARLLRFGAFELDIEACELRKSGRRIALALQPLSVLAALAARPGEVVTREELRRELWADGIHVDFDAGLNRGLSALRRVLGDSAHAPRFVETVPRRGYRFLASVGSVRDAS